MSGNKVNAKTKGRDDKNKSNKNVEQNSEDTEDNIDYTLLRKSVATSVTGFAQAVKIFDSVTEEVKALLSNECDMLYECKVCRNIFRSLANFISHKRVYCKDKFSYNVHGHFVNTNTTANELKRLKKFEEGYQEYLKTEPTLAHNEDRDRIPLTKDLTAVVEKIAATKAVQEEKLKQQEIVLQEIPKTSVAVYQSVKSSDNDDDMRTQVNELDSILSKENAVMQRDGKFNIQSNVEIKDKDKDNDNVIQISDDEDDNETLKCKLCEQEFSTRKTLKSHIKIKHLGSRLVYPCIECLEIFSTSWSVYRHLFKVHRKTAAQVRRLRETIQLKAFRMNNPPPSYEKRKVAKTPAPQKITEEERIEQENQAWMDNIEGDGEAPRCGGCGRTFERRAALAAHTHTCQPRTRALARRHDKKIEIQIRKDYNKGPQKQDKMQTDDVPSPKPPPQKAETDPKNDCLTEAIMSIVGVTSETNESVEVNAIQEIEPKPEEPKAVHKIPYSHQAEKTNFDVLKKRVMQDIEIEKLLCKKCDEKCKDFIELFNHVAAHYKWVRYACKLCNFKHFDYEKVPEHVKIVHKLKGDAEFYFSTIKAVGGNEALELSDLKDDNEPMDSSPNSRRPSRCSSDSSRLSDDSSSSSVRIEVGRRKRKVMQYKNKQKPIDEGDGDSKDSESSPSKDPLHIEDDHSFKGFDENSSDIDDSDERPTKRVKAEYVLSATSRRPIRKRTKRKNEDFEYDLSNLLKMEAKGYREAQSTEVRPAVTKKKTQNEFYSSYNSINKDCSGALLALSRIYVSKNKAHMKTSNITVFNKLKDVQRISNIFVRPMLPKISRSEKVSPMKEPDKDKKNSPKLIEVSEAIVLDDNNVEQSTPSEQNEIANGPIVNSAEVSQALNEAVNEKSDKDVSSKEKSQENSVEEIDKTKEIDKPNCSSDNTDNKAITNNSSSNYSIIFSEDKEKDTTTPTSDKPKLNPIPAIKIQKQSAIDIINNPLIKKNLKEFNNAGMKRKILVIKPMNRKDGQNAPLTFQRIKIKDSTLLTKDQERKAVVVKVPTVESKLPKTVLSNNNTVVDMPQESKPENCDTNQKDNEKLTEANDKVDSEVNKEESCGDKNSLPTVTDTEVAVS